MIRASIRRPVAVTMAYIALAVLGVVAWYGLPIELMPDTRLPRLYVRASWRGASPELTEAFLTAPLEAAVQQVRGVERIQSVSSESYGYGHTGISVEFARDTDMDFARLELSERIAAIRDELPAAARRSITIEQYAPDDFEAQNQPFLEYTVTGPYTLPALRAHIDEVVTPELLRIEGVAEVRAHGGRQRVVEIELNQDQIRALGLSIPSIRRRIQALNYVSEAGAVLQENKLRTLAIRHTAESVRELLDVPLLTGTGAGARVVRLGDIAVIHDAYETPTSLYRIDGFPAVSFSVYREIGTNTIEVADRVKAEIAAMGGLHPAGVRLILDRDESEAIKTQLTDLRSRALISAIVIFLVLLVFLRSFRSAGVVFATIGFAILITLNFLYFAGFTLNILTLMGLAMGFGLIVDNAIVVLENTYRRRRLGDPAPVAAERGAREVVLAVLAATLTTVIVLVPFVYLQGELRVYYVPLAIVVGFALLASMLVAFTFIPGLASRLLAGIRPKKESELASSNDASGGTADRPLYVRFYAGMLRFTLRHPWVTAILAVGMFAGSYHLFDKYVVRGVVWSSWYGQDTYIRILIDQPRGEELGRTDALVRYFEDRLSQLPEVERFVSNVRPQSARIRVTFPDSLEHTSIPVAIKEQMVAYSHRFGGTEVRVYGFGPSFYGGGGSAPNYSVEILGYNYEKAREIARNLAARFERFARIRDVDTNSWGRWYTEDVATELVLRLNRARLGLYGLRSEDVVWQVAAAVQGQFRQSRIRIGGEELQYSIKLAGHRDMNVKDLERLLLGTRTGNAVRLGSVATLYEREVLNRIIRENQQYQRLVSYEFQGPGKLGNLIRDAVLEATEVPPGYEIQTEDNWSWSDEQRDQIYMVLAISLVLVFMMTAGVFESLRQPFCVLLTVPMALIGVFMIFFYTGASFTREAYVGVIMMGGIVVNNAILLVDHVNQLRKREGMALEPAVVRGTLERVRPIMMTSTTTILGLLPLVLFSEGANENIWNALAYALIGGLTASTLLVLTVTPVIYFLLERRKARRVEAAVPAALLLACVFALGCGAGDASTGGGVVTRDSAGITIVENSGDGLWQNGDEWRVAPEPTVAIGTLQGEPAYQLFRASDAARLSDGTVVVANAGTHELRYFGPEGRHLRTVGGEGGGPGEFEGLRSIARLPGDTIMAWDMNGTRLSTFTGDGDFVGSNEVRGASAFAKLHGILPDGSLVLSSGFNRIFADAVLERYSPTYVHFDATGESSDTIGRFPGRQLYSMSSDDFAMKLALPFGRSTTVDVFEGLLYIGNNERYQIAMYDMSGALEMLVRRNIPPVEVTPEAISTLKALRLERAIRDRLRRATERLFEEAPIPQTMPAYARILVDRAGNLWVRDYTLPGSEAARWAVFDRRGRLLGTVEMPGALSVFEIGADHVIGSMASDVGVQRILSYELIKPG